MTAPTISEYRVADRLGQAMEQAGVNTLFSLSGNQIMPVYDALVDLSIRLVHSRHEAAAVFMAEAYAQVSGQLGVALVTAGPGFGNALGALYSASMSEVPVMLLSGDAPRSQDGRGAFQQFDQVAAATPFVKASLRPDHHDDIAEVFARAAGIARRGVPGPVHIALPFDVLNQGAQPGPLPAADETVCTGKLAESRPLPELIESLASELGNARRPVILVGPHLGRGGNREALDNLSRRAGAPVIVLDSPRGVRDPAKGAFRELLGAADLVVYLGKPVDFTTAMANPEVIPARRIVVVSEVAAVLEQAKASLGDRLIIAEQANPLVLIGELHEYLAAHHGGEDPPASLEKWQAKAENALNHRILVKPSDENAASRAFGEIINQAVARHPHCIVICDGGEVGQWAQAYIKAETLLTNGPGGAIGASLPYAIGAQLARPDARVIAVMGDGTVGFHLAEFETAARESLGITVVIGNDSRWNAEHHIQRTQYGEYRTMGCTLSPNIRYDQVAAGLGGHGEYIADLSRLPDCLDRALEAGHSGSQPTCLNVILPGAPAPVYQPFSI